MSAGGPSLVGGFQPASSTQGICYADPNKKVCASTEPSMNQTSVELYHFEEPGKPTEGYRYYKALAFNTTKAFIFTGERNVAKRHEGYLVGWLMHTEFGYRDNAPGIISDDSGANMTPNQMLDKALDWFVSFKGVAHGSELADKAGRKKQHWQIKLPLILLENIDTPRVQSILKRHRAFFGFDYPTSGTRKERIFAVMQILMARAEKYKDPALLAEIYLKMGIFLNEKGEYQEANGYFKKAEAAAQLILADRGKYRGQYLERRIDRIKDSALRGAVEDDYYIVAELQRVRSIAHKTIAQCILLRSRDGQEIPFAELKDALDHTKKAQEELLRPKGGKRWVIAYYYAPIDVYHFFGEIYTMLDLQRVEGDIYARMGLLLKDSCPDQADKYVRQATEIYDRIIRWKDDFVRERIAESKRNPPFNTRLHPNVPGSSENDRSILSEWGADIVGNTYLAKARLLMSVYPPPNDPKAYVRQAGDLLIKAGEFLVKPDDYNFQSARAEYLIRMDIESSPKALTSGIKEGRAILESIPKSFIYGQVLLARVYMKEERFGDAARIIQSLLEDPAYAPVRTKQFTSSLYQMQAELAQEDDRLVEADALFDKALCAYPYNFYAQLGRADIANWSARFDDAAALYKTVLANPHITINIKKRIELAQAEVALRRVTLDPSANPAKEADEVIRQARLILQTSDEIFMLERALESTIEALVAKKEDGLAELRVIRDQLLAGSFNIAAYAVKCAIAAPELRERTRANLILKVADGFLFVNEYAEARGILDNYFKGFDPLFAERPDIKAHFLLTSAEITQRTDQYNERAIAQVEEAGKIIFSMAPERRDPNLAERVIKDLVDIYVNKDDFAAALAFVYAAQGMENKAIRARLETLGGIIDDDTFEHAIEVVRGAAGRAGILDGANVKGIFENRGLTIQWGFFAAELQIKEAEILCWTKNFAEAAQLAEEIKKSAPFTTKKMKKLHLARVAILEGNIDAQYRWKRDYPAAFLHYQEALGILSKFTDPNLGQERILVESELYLNIANLHRYGYGENGLKDFVEAIKYYGLAFKRASAIKGNDDLKHYYLARIYIGYMKLAEVEKRLNLALPTEAIPDPGSNKTPSREYWPSDILPLAEEYAQRIVRKWKYSANKLLGELAMEHQNHARGFCFRGDSSLFFYEQAAGLRTFERTAESRNILTFCGSLEKYARLLPFLSNQRFQVDGSLSFVTDLDADYGSVIESVRAGTTIKPAYWLSGSANVHFLNKYLNRGNNTTLQYLKYPLLSLSTSASLPAKWGGDEPGLRGLNATLSFDVDGDPGYNSQYLNVSYNAGRDADHPLAQGLSAGLQLLHFNYFSSQGFYDRYRAGLPLGWEFDLKYFDFADNDRLFYLYPGMARLGIGITPFYEHALDSDGSVENAGAQFNLRLTLNLLSFKVFLEGGLDLLYLDLMRKYRIPDDERLKASGQGRLMLEGRF